MSNKTDNRTPKAALINPAIYSAMSDLEEGRYAVPFRALFGYVEKRNLRILGVLSLDEHLAILGMQYSGIGMHDAVMMIKAGDAGAFRGDLIAFDQWDLRESLQEDGLVASKLPDGTPLTIWWRHRELVKPCVPMLLGWSQGKPCAFEDIDLSPTHVWLH
jgi:hypothetical protein